MKNVEVGQFFFEEEIKNDIDEIQIVKYAGASGGFNPIHFVDDVGKQAGFNGVIAQGMLVKGIVSKIILQHIPLLSLIKFDSKFVGVVEPREKLKLISYVTDIKTEQQKSIYTCDYKVENDKGEFKITGNFSFKN